MKKSWFILFSSILVFQYFNQVALAEVIHVPEDFEVLQTAVNRASDGDTIIVAPGEYERITIRNKDDLTLIGAGLDAERKSTIYGLPRTRTEVALNAINCNNLEIKGFELTEGYTAIWLQRCDHVWVHENYIHDLPSWWSSSISVSSTDNLMIERNIMLRSWHYGVYIDGNILGPTCDNITVRNNVIGWMVNNDGIYLEDVDGIDIYNNIIIENGDIGIYECGEVRNLRVEYNCLFENDDANHRGFNLSRTNIIENPDFVECRCDNFHLDEDSPCIDAGDPDSPGDPDDSRADIGVYPLPEVEEEDPDDRHFDFERTEENHALLIRNATFNDDELEENDEIGVFTPGGLCAGAGIWEADGIGLVAWMDDEDTDEIDGFREGEHFFFRVWRHEEDEEYPAESEWQHGPSVFRPDAFSVLSIHVSSVLECTIEMQQGWNLISANVEPSVRNIIEIFSPLTERDNCPLVVVKDQFGHFYLPDWGFNNIPDWVFSEGYLILLTEAAELTIEGDYIEPDRSIELHAGWQLVAYYPAWELDVEDAVASITDNLFLVKDQAGAFYIPRYRFCNMEPLQTGQGYWLWMIRDDDLVYPAERPGRDDNRLGEDRVQHIYKPIFTDNNMSLLLTGNGLLPGDEVIALNSSEEVIGSGIAENNGYCGITLWGRSNFSPEDKGLDDGEVPQFRVIRGIYSLEASLKVIEGSSSYKANTFTLAEIIFADNPMANSFNLFEPYPNPFNNETLISFNLRVNGMVHLELIDISGKLVKTLVDDQYNAGYHRVSLNAEGLSNGIYILRLIANDGNAVRKISLIR